MSPLHHAVPRWFSNGSAWRRLPLVLALLACLLGNSSCIFWDFGDDDPPAKFDELLSVKAEPLILVASAGESVETVVTLRYPGGSDPALPTVGVELPAQRFTGLTFDVSPSGADNAPPDGFASTVTLQPLEPSLESGRPSVCDHAPENSSGAAYLLCRTYRLTVPGGYDAQVRLRATWQIDADGNTATREAEFYVELPPPAPGAIAVALSAPQDLFATRGSLDFTLSRSGAAAGLPVTLELIDPGSGDTVGSFDPNPAPGDTARLNLQIPARYAAGMSKPLRVRATADRFSQTLDFTQRIAPLFGLQSDPPELKLDPSQAVDATVRLTFPSAGPGSRSDFGPATLALQNLPQGVTAQFLPDALPSRDSPARTLRLITDGSLAGFDSLRLRATAIAQPPDHAGAHPYIEASIPLSLYSAPAWIYVNNGASPTANPVDLQSIGLLSQAGGLPLVGWLEGRMEASSESRRVFLRRYDGSVWTPVPTSGETLAEAAGPIEDATLALAPGDAPWVAYSFHDAPATSVVALATASSSAWSRQRVVTASGSTSLDTPRLAVAANGAQTVAYVQATGSAPSTAARALIVTRRASPAAAWTRLTGPQPDGSINRDADGRVLAGTVALAQSLTGDTLVAWIEQPIPPGAPRLWVRRHSGGSWGSAVAIATGAGLVSAPLQLVFDGDGRSDLAWLEGSPAQVMVAQQQNALAAWTRLPDSRLPSGALNMSATDNARDVSLALDGSGNLVVGWAEGEPKPKVWAKAYSASGWLQLGGAIDPTGLYVTRFPRVAQGTRPGEFYVCYTRNLLEYDDITHVQPLSDLFVVRWSYY